MINIDRSIFEQLGRYGMAEKDDVKQVSEKAKSYFDQGFN
jgi:ribosomal protein S19E (S16A)